MDAVVEAGRTRDGPAREARSAPRPAWHKTVQNTAAKGGILKAKTAFCARPQVVSVEDTPEGLRKLAAVEVNEGERVRLKEAVKVVHPSVKEKAQLTEGSFATE